MMHRKTRGGRRFRRRARWPVIFALGVAAVIAGGVALAVTRPDGHSETTYPSTTSSTSLVPASPRIVVPSVTPTPESSPAVAPSPMPKATVTHHPVKVHKPLPRRKHRPRRHHPAPKPAHTASPKPKPTPTRTAAPAQTPEQQMYALIAGVRDCPIRMDSGMSLMAERWSAEMQRTGIFGHSPYLWYGQPMAENVAQGWGGAKATFDAWMRSDGHRRNILNCNYTRIGIGQTSDWWTAAFS